MINREKNDFDFLIMEDMNYTPMLSKDAVKYITQNITPEEVQYVADIKQICDDCEDCGCDEKQCDDVVYVTKIIAFADKFRALHWAADNMSYHRALDDFCNELEEYKDAIAENIQSIIGQFSGKEFTHISLPVSNDPLEIINELKICVNNWLKCHKEGVEYEGCRNATSGFLETVHKYVYIFRLCRKSD